MCQMSYLLARGVVGDIICGWMLAVDLGSWDASHYAVYPFWVKERLIDVG